MNPNQDDLDRMLQGDDQNPASPAQNQDQGDDLQQQDQQSPEEVEFNSLTGSTQERIRKLAKDKRELLTQLEQQKNAYIPPAPSSNFQDPQEQAAIQTLAAKGIATDAKVDAKLDDRFNAIRWELEQNRLESRYVGKGDEPQYVREEVESFIQQHPQYRSYAPEDVFRYKMFPDEFMNVELTKRGVKSKQTSTMRPTKQAVAQEGMTPEYIESRLQQPDGRQWYDDHLDEINAVLSKMNPENQ